MKENKTIKDYMQVLELVEHYLSDDLACRNDDNHLIRTIWNVQPRIPASSITRARRQIQNTQGRFLPTLPGVLTKRRIKEQVIRQYFRNKPDIVLAYENYAYEYKDIMN